MTIKKAEDLFGEISVNKQEIKEWIDIIAPNISNRYKKYYEKNWDVVGKIQAAKRNGTFNEIMKIK